MRNKNILLTISFSTRGTAPIHVALIIPHKPTHHHTTYKTYKTLSLILYSMLLRIQVIINCSDFLLLDISTEIKRRNGENINEYIKRLFHIAALIFLSSRTSRLVCLCSVGYYLHRQKMNTRLIYVSNIFCESECQ
jgi:hypothetical protein